MEDQYGLSQLRQRWSPRRCAWPAVAFSAEGQAALHAGDRFLAVDNRFAIMAGEYEQTTGLRRPMRFTDADGQPAALKPGHTWVHVVTPSSEVYEVEPGVWRVRFYAPAGAK